MSETVDKQEKLLQDLENKINRLVELSEKRIVGQSLSIGIAKKTSTKIESFRHIILNQQIELSDNKGHIKIVNQFDNLDMILANLQARINIQKIKLSDSDLQHKISENYSVQSDVEKKDYEIFSVLIAPETRQDAIEFCKAKIKSIVFELEEEQEFYNDDDEQKNEVNEAEVVGEIAIKIKTEKIEKIEKIEKDTIKVLGHWQTLFNNKTKIIGYVPSDIAIKLINANAFNYFFPELLTAEIDEQEKMKIEIGIKGVKDRYVANIV